MDEPLELLQLCDQVLNLQGEALEAQVNLDGLGEGAAVDTHLLAKDGHG